MTHSFVCMVYKLATAPLRQYRWEKPEKNWRHYLALNSPVQLIILCVDEIRALLGHYATYIRITYRRFGTTCRSHLQGSRNSRMKKKAFILYFFTFEARTGRFSRNVGIQYHCTLCNIPEEGIAHVFRAWWLKSRLCDDESVFCYY